ncbi:hypothetical protein [Agromyces sp. CCNWLW203]|uniref:hypothetical protein n=1 Tax=Agromyces sp. CCNWLW203 TaxID=3112842 RepID=UPI002F96E0FF
MSLSRSTRRSRPGAFAALAAAGALAALLSGCAGGAPTPSPSPSADAAEPIFASDEEALAAAEAGYSEHLALVDLLTAAGGADVAGLDDVATSEYAANIKESLQRLQESGARTEGSTRFDSAGLIEQFDSDGAATVDVYLCLDVSEVRVLDASGKDVTPTDRKDRAPIQVELVSASAGDPAHLLVAGAQSWSGDDFC